VYLLYTSYVLGFCDIKIKIKNSHSYTFHA
jgi:hypothetical protein